MAFKVGDKFKTQKGNIGQITKIDSLLVSVEWIKHETHRPGVLRVYKVDMLNGSRHFDYKYIEGPAPKPEKQKCKCDIRVIMMLGCQCGGK